MKNSCEKKLKMVENGVESEIKLGETTLRDTFEGYFVTGSKTGARCL